MLREDRDDEAGATGAVIARSSCDEAIQNPCGDGLDSFAALAKTRNEHRGLITAR